MNNPFKSVLVVGDVMLDAWQQVDPNRVSSEAPVLIARHIKSTFSPGGAGNAAINIKHLGVEVTLVGLRGDDAAGRRLHAGLIEQGVRVDLQISKHNQWQTIEKCRLVDSLGRHILRVDYEADPTSIHEADRTAMEKAVNANRGRTSLLISDYGKGTLDRDLTVITIGLFRGQGKFIVVNGKPEHLVWYHNASCLIFNRAEAEAAVGKSVAVDRGAVTEKLYDQMNGSVRDIIMTDGANGLYWNAGGGTVRHFTAPKVEVADVGGAGDTIAATIAARGCVSPEVLQLAIRNAAKVVSQRGTSVPE